MENGNVDSLFTLFAVGLGCDFRAGGLCATQGGVHVYETVELGPEYFDKDGVPLFYDDNSIFEEMSLGERYFANLESEIISRSLNVEKRYSYIEDRKTDSKLGSITHYMYYGGWFSKYSMFHVGGELCPENKRYSEYIKEMSTLVFLKKK